MPYEVSDIAAPTAPAPQQTMREERTLEPYRNRVSKTKTGSPDTSDSAAASVKPVESVTLSPQASALAKKEAEFRKQEAEFKAKETQLEKDRQEIADMRALKAKLAAKDFSGIENDVPYDAYTNYLIEKGNSQTPEGQELKKLASEIEAIKKEHKDDVSKRFEAAVNERRKEVKALVEAKDTAYPRIQKAKAQEAVIKHILDTWEHDNLDLSPEEAAKEVEEQLKQMATEWSALAEPATVETVKVTGKDIVKELPPLKAKVSTLTNNLTPIGDGTGPRKSLYGLSDSERWAEARRRAEEKLKASKA